MSTCTECQHVRLRLNQLIIHYEQLIETKDQQITCSYSIIKQLERELKTIRDSYEMNSIKWKDNDKEYKKLIYDQQQLIQYLKGREQKLMQEIKKAQNQIFIITNDEENEEPQNINTPQKIQLRSKFSHASERNQKFKSSKRNLQISPLQDISSFNCNKSQNIKLKVAKDQLNVVDIKYKMALLRAAEFATFQSPIKPILK